MMWDCGRCDHPGGMKDYGSAATAQRYATALDKEDRDELGRRAPLLGMFPLRIARYLRRKMSS